MSQAAKLEAASRSRPCSHDILGNQVRVLGWEEAIFELQAAISRRSFTRISFLNAHNANLASTARNFKQVLERFTVLPDGLGVDIAARLLYGQPFPANLNGTDFVPALLAATATPLRIGLIGTTEERNSAAAVLLQDRYKQHQIVFRHHGFFSPAEEAALLAGLAEARPDILLVGMGVPRQEFWIADKLDHRHCTLAFGIGALLDFLSEDIPRAPQWVRSLRMEWLYRLALEPKRLWRRYILGNPLFLTRVLRQKIAGSAGGA
ncbi:WecB/TagA/CpsF family glycosyltransferase [Nitratireductor basaltis]|uniref:UDP-N-acetyl-D-mannosaminuronic acid transferase n=1 Tax=Nitratireductor basaltis TaxID=472175 RepID=A0A084UDU8_9HYPH|nr:WecB/TagA/CpsF family glycosyltransferase [Nitratireductor basaltis]KFB11134.1 UDP-N-acetyl-D-mannosaminuronic acid transferase [Nitratireductor basaltis]